jgi:hypothetical protein
VRAVACVLVLLLVGCSGGTAAPRAGSADFVGPLPSGLPAIQNTQETCTQVDLNGPELTMPAPHNVTSTAVINTGVVARLDPAPGVTAQFSADAAWQKFTLQNPLHARRAELLLGIFNAYIPFGQTGPQRVHALSWVLRLHHLAYAIPAVSNGDTGSGLAAPQAVCEFVDAVLVLDATTGAVIVYSY